MQSIGKINHNSICNYGCCLISFTVEYHSSIYIFILNQFRFFDTRLCGHAIINQSKANNYIAMKMLGNYYDKYVCKILKEDETAINELDSSYLIECFNNGLNEIVRHVLNNYEEFGRSAFMKICFDSDLSGNTPLMNMIRKLSFKEDIIIELWNIMINTKDPRLEGLLNRTNTRMENIFHLCALFKRYDLFKQIAKEIWESDKKLDRYEVLGALFKKNINGQLPVHVCKDEQTIMTVLSSFTTKVRFRADLHSVFINIKTAKRKNALHIFAKEGFKEVVDWIMDFVSMEALKKLLLERNNRQNNPLMVCVLYNQTEILKSFLMLLFSGKTCNKEEINQILHQGNENGDTLLGLVLQHKSTLRLPEILLLEKEKEFHTGKNKDETMFDLSSCLKNTARPSAEVANALTKLHESFPEIDSCEKLKIWIPIFISTLIIPIAIQGLDMGTDVVISTSYLKELREKYVPIAEYAYRNACQVDTSNALLSYPVKLQPTPKIVYSFAFITIPWVFYLIEFWVSVHFKTIKEEVRTHKNIG